MSTVSGMGSPHSDLEVTSMQQRAVADKYYADRPEATTAESGPPQYFYPQDGEKKRTICGMRGTTFILAVALVLVILAAGIGGGVGGTMAVNNAKKEGQAQGAVTSTVYSTITAPPTSATSSSSASSSSSTATTTTASRLSVPTTGILALDCPSIHQSTLSLTLSQTSDFTVLCGRDYPGASNDILAVAVYSLRDCARACASYNLNRNGKFCKGATFNSNLGDNVRVNFGNCWLKNGTGNGNDGGGNEVASVVLN